MNRPEEELLFEFLIIKGLKKIGKFDNPRYVARAKHEFDRIVQKKYVNYFLIVHGYIVWAKKNGIKVGPGRGSVSASLVAYCLDITEIDPIEHELLFARFISSIRKDFVDIDQDFADDRREEVFAYLKETYGKEHCAKVMTYARFHPKGILKDVGRIFDIPVSETNKIASLCLEKSGGDARASFALSDTFSEFDEAKKFRERYPEQTDIMMKLESSIRHKSIHAAALITTERDISSYVPLNLLRDEIATEWEKASCEDMHLIKFDILGLKTLSVINDAILMAKTELPKTFDDNKVYQEIFVKGNTNSIFQFSTVGMTKLTQAVGVKNFNELYDCSALFRPSCLHSGQTSVYTARAQGKENATPIHPLLDSLTKKTKGVIIYQETIMKIMYEIGGMSWATAEMSRKIITKSKGKDAFNKLRGEFVANANRIHALPLADGEKLFDVVSTFGSYGFNQAHSIAYSAISYWCGWLKYYFPLEFYAAVLKHEQDSSEIMNCLQDAEKRSIHIEFPDINKSKESYSVVDGKIYAGFDSLIGIGAKASQKILFQQPFVDLHDFLSKVKPTKKVWQALVIADAFREFGINRKVCYESDPKTKFNAFDKLTPEFDDMDTTKLIYQHTTLKPKMEITKTFDFGTFPFIDIAKLNDSHGGTMQFVRGIVTAVINKDKLLRPELNDHIHKFQRHMYYVNVNDGTGNLAVQVGPATYEKYAELMEYIEKQPIVAWGTLSKDGKKMYGDVLQIVSKEHRTHDIDNIMTAKESLRRGEAIIVSAQPAVSKNKKSYYRVTLHNDVKGMCFRFSQKLQVGMKVAYGISKPPFIDLRIINEVPK